jgi:hypothetical protein
MRQEVQATILVTYDAPAKLSRNKLKDQVHDDVMRLLDADSGSHIEATNITILGIREEAEIYGND